MQPQFQECELGYTYENASTIVFFGKSDADLEKIQKRFPQIQFSKIRQTHSDKLVKASSEENEADAHWTRQRNLGLLIATADCMPIMISHSETHVVAAIHAGWKGIANQIVCKTLRFLIENYPDNAAFDIWIGPHIMKDSFEVKKDVLDLLLASSYSKNLETQFSTNGDSYQVDLKSIVLSQMNAAIDRVFSVSEISVDTKTNLFLNSFRRDRSLSGRNLSFISRK